MTAAMLLLVPTSRVMDVINRELELGFRKIPMGGILLVVKGHCANIVMGSETQSTGFV